jgi:hypothetical protein
MKKIIKNTYVSWGLRTLFILLAIVIILGFTFMQGMFYANKKSTLIMANDGAYQAWIALISVKDADYKRCEGQTDAALDVYSYKLAEFLLQHPSYAQRHHYNLLKKVRDYRKKYMRHKQNFSQIDDKTVDTTINKAIAMLEATHDTKIWGVSELIKFK